MTRPLRLLPWPNPAWKENPCHKLLCQGLQRSGIRLVRSPPAFSLLPYLPRYDWLYLFWSEHLYAAKDPRQREEQFERFMETLLKLKKRGTRIVWTMNNEHPHEADDVAFYRRAYARIIDVSDLVHVHFAAAVEYVTREYHVRADKIIVVPHGHYSNYYGDPVPKARARAMLGIPPEARVILSLGYLRKYKGLEEAIASFRATKNANLCFLIAGKPEDRGTAAYCRAEATQDSRLVMQLGKVREKDVAPLLSAADAFLFPSRTFFTSGSIMLALTYGLPFIAMPRNHALQFVGKSFFKPWQPADKETLTAILDGLDEWLASVDLAELAETKSACDTNTLTVEFSRRLREM